MARSLAVGCVVVMMAGAARGQTTQAGGAGGEGAAVIAAYQATMKALMAEDVEELMRRAYAPGAENALRLLMEDEIAKHAAGKALLARFGADGRFLIADSLAFDDDLGRVVEETGTAQVKVTGDTAVISSSPREHLGIMAQMRRVNGQWKLDQLAYATRLAKDDAAEGKLRADAAVMKDWTRRIKAGEYANVNAAQAGLGLLTAATEKQDGVAATQAEENRWARKAHEAGLTPVQKAVYEQDVDRTLAAIGQQDDSLKEDEAAECAEALGQIGATEELPKVEDVCAMFSAHWAQRHKPLGSMEIGNLFQAYHGEALLGEKAAALDELQAIQERFQGEWEESARQEYARRMETAETW